MSRKMKLQEMTQVLRQGVSIAALLTGTQLQTYLSVYALEW